VPARDRRSFLRGPDPSRLVATAVALVLTVALALAMPTTYTAAGPCDRTPACVVSFPHVLVRTLVFVAGVAIASLFNLLGRNQRTKARDGRILAVIAAVILLVGLVVAFRYPPGFVPIPGQPGALTLQSWLGYRVLIAAASIGILAATAFWLLRLGDAGLEGLRVLSVSTMAASILVAITIPILRRCPERAGWFYNDRIRACVSALRTGPLGTAPEPSTDLRLLDRGAVIAAGLAASGLLRSLIHRVESRFVGRAAS
jgi:hypothetical protein